MDSVKAPQLTAAPPVAAQPKPVVTVAIKDPKDSIGGGPDEHVVALQTQLSQLLEHSITHSAPVGEDKQAAALELLNKDIPPEQGRWAIVTVGGAEVLQKVFPFKAYGGEKGEMKFTSQVMNLGHLTKHHPGLGVEYGKCEVRYTTHDIGNRVHANDFLLAARTDGLLRTLPNVIPPA